MKVLSINNANTQLWATIYNKLKYNKRNVKNPFITVLRRNGSRNKSATINKEYRGNKDENNKSNHKKRIFKNILYSKQQTFSPKSC